MFIQYDGRELKVGDKIKLGGREGKISHVTKFLQGEIKPGSIRKPDYVYLIEWPDSTYSSLVLSSFPDFEIWIEDPKISKVAAEELKKWAASITLTNGPLYHLLLEKIDSMTE